jgi:hypothetical protein
MASFRRIKKRRRFHQKKLRRSKFLAVGIGRKPRSTRSVRLLRGNRHHKS